LLLDLAGSRTSLLQSRHHVGTRRHHRPRSWLSC